MRPGSVSDPLATTRHQRFPRTSYEHVSTAFYSSLALLFYSHTNVIYNPQISLLCSLHYPFYSVALLLCALSVWRWGAGRGAVPVMAVPVRRRGAWPQASA